MSHHLNRRTPDDIYGDDEREPLTRGNFLITCVFLFSSAWVSIYCIWWLTNALLWE